MLHEHHNFGHSNFWANQLISEGHPGFGLPVSSASCASCAQCSQSGTRETRCT